MHHIRYEIDSDVARQIFIKEFTNKKDAREFLLKPPSGSKGFDYWDSGDYTTDSDS